MLFYTIKKLMKTFKKVTLTLKTLTRETSYIKTTNQKMLLKKR